MALNNRILLFLAMVLLAPFFGISQTTNIGTLTVMGNTKLSITNNFNNRETASVWNDGVLLVNAGFNNDGAFSFTDAQNEGLVRFQGNSAQKISGAALSEFYNVAFANTSIENRLELSGDISIVNLTKFDTGILNNRDFGGTITFETSADHTDASNISHVQGQVQKNGSTYFNFPVGDAGFYRKVSVSQSGNKSTIFSAEYLLENSNSNYPHHQKEAEIEHIDTNEYWILQGEAGNSDGLVSLGWDTATTPNELLTAPETTLRIVRWNTENNNWEDQGGIVDTQAQTVTTAFAFSGLGIFTLAKIKEVEALPGNITVYNSITPNGNGKNDFLRFKGIDKFPNNTVFVYNRWGTKVFETTGYNDSDNVFRGYSATKPAISKDSSLPSGTYFYVLVYEYKQGQETKTFRKAGYLYINVD